MYPRFPPQLEKNNETLTSLRDEARFHCIACRAMPCSQPNRKGALICLTELESPPEVPHNSRRTLMSPQECEIARCSPNQLEMTTNCPALASEQCPVSCHTGQLAWLPFGNSRHSLRHTSQVNRNTNFSTGTRGKLHAPHVVLRRELIPRILLKR